MSENILIFVRLRLAQRSCAPERELIYLCPYGGKVVIFSVLSACGELVAIITPDLRIITQTLSSGPPSLVSEKGEEGGGAELKEFH